MSIVHVPVMSIYMLSLYKTVLEQFIPDFADYIEQ